MRNKTNSRREDPLPENFDSIEQFWEFWDTHSSADYEDLMEPVDFEIDLQSSKTYCAISRDMLQGIRATARQQGVSAETLINLWLQEKLSSSRSPQPAYSVQESSERYTADRNRRDT